MSVTIELFPCSGGMAEGFRRAGIVFDFAFDKDPNACASYERNHGHRPMEMDVRDLVRMVLAGWSPGPVRLLVADPPCTPWSRAGLRRGVEDERDMLGETTELIRLLKPDAYLIGNVPGLDDATQWHHLQEALAPLHREGYCIADYVSLDASDFGVPQHRVRPFWFGHLRGPCIRWPMPTHGPPTGQACLPGTELKPWVTCREALQHLSPKDLGRPCRLRYRAAQATTEEQRKRAGKKARASRPEEPAETIRAKADAPMALVARPDGGHPVSWEDEPSRTLRADGGRAGRSESVLAFHEDHNLSRPDAPAKTVTRNTHGDGVVLVNERHPPAQPAQPAQTLGAKDRGQSTVLEWPWERPATTVLADPRLAPPDHHSEEGSWLSRPEWDRPSTTVFAGTDQTGGPGHGSPGSRPNAVVLSEKAATILQGFPESWHFAGETKKARWSQLGQAMPPALAHAVARAVVEQLRLSLEEAA